MTRKLGPLSQSELYLQEDDFLDKANVTVMRGRVKWIDLEKKYIEMAGAKRKIEFDKVLVAWGADKRRFKAEGTNIFYLEDKQSHARVHNELLKAKQVVVFGGSVEAYQIAATCRDYLDFLGYRDTKIMLLNAEKTDLQKNLGSFVTREIHKMLKDKRISVVVDADIKDIEGAH